MSVRLLNESSVFVMLQKQRSSLLQFGRSIRFMSSQYDPKLTEKVVKYPEEHNKGEEDTSTYSVNVLENLFGPADKRLPLPGNLGLAENIKRKTKFKKAQRPVTHIDNPNNYGYHMNMERQARVLATHEIMDKERELAEMDAIVEPPVIPYSADAVEFKAVDCPKLLRVQFSPLFPDRNLLQGPLTVINFTQLTKHDMAQWSEEMEEEREQLLASFFRIATDIAMFLKKDGFWADFIDPASGRPCFGGYTNHTLFETDERYKYLGFQIEDLGCCKVIRHSKWGTKIFIGTLFTNSPLNSSALETLMKKYELDSKVKTSLAHEDSSDLI